MPHNKDQHYVPQFYLRNFGVGDSIALFNLKRRVHVDCASIPGQCQRAYLYGKDGPVEPRSQRSNVKPRTRSATSLPVRQCSMIQQPSSN